MLLGHILVFRLPLVARGLKGLNLSLIVARFPVGLAKPIELSVKRTGAFASASAFFQKRTSQQSRVEFYLLLRPPLQVTGGVSEGPRSGYHSEDFGWQHPLPL
jgi:hypothetical protein